jgi:site-specific DNA-cytosine methylase
MNSPIPIIDIFAGPGGLGEGFSSLKSDSGESIFKVKLSIEKDIHAYRTLELRAFFRQFNKDSIPSSYYEYLKGRISREELFGKYPKESSSAKNEAWLIELKNTNQGKVKSRINAALDGSIDWVLIGGPPCQAYSLVGCSPPIPSVVMNRNISYWLNYMWNLCSIWSIWCPQEDTNRYVGKAAFWPPCRHLVSDPLGRIGNAIRRTACVMLGG